MNIKEFLENSIKEKDNIVRVVVQEIGQDTKHTIDTHSDHIYNAIDLFGYIDIIYTSQRFYDTGMEVTFHIEENPKWH